MQVWASLTSVADAERDDSLPERVSDSTQTWHALTSQGQVFQVQPTGAELAHSILMNGAKNFPFTWKQLLKKRSAKKRGAQLSSTRRLFQLSNSEISLMNTNLMMIANSNANSGNEYSGDTPAWLLPAIFGGTFGGAALIGLIIYLIVRMRRCIQKRRWQKESEELQRKREIEMQEARERAHAQANGPSTAVKMITSTVNWLGSAFSSESSQEESSADSHPERAAS